MLPTEFPRDWEQFAENYCFIHNTYYVASGEEIPVELTARDERQSGYYQVGREGQENAIKWKNYSSGSQLSWPCRP
jgi:hypothetical protein